MVHSEPTQHSTAPPGAGSDERRPADAGSGLATLRPEHGTRGAWVRHAAVALLVSLPLAACSGESPEGGVPASDAPAAGLPASESAAPASSDNQEGASGSVALEPGEYESPLVQLQRLQSQNDHLHVDEVRYRDSDKRLFQCSYTFGVVDASNPAEMEYQAEMIRHNIPDVERLPGCIHLAPDGDIVYTTHRGNLRNPAFLSGWDISKTDLEDPEVMVPEQIAVVQEPGVSYEGVDVSDGHVFVAIREDGMGVYRRDPDSGEIARVGSLGDLGSTWGMRVSGDTAYLTDIHGNLVTVDVSNPEQPVRLGSVAVGGVPRGLAVDDGLVYVAAGSAGLVIVDATDPAAPVVVGQADTPGTAIRVDVSDGRAFVADWNDARVYDVSNPAEPRFIDAVRLTTDVVYPDDDGRPPVTARTLGIAANGLDVFVGNWWVLHSFRLYPERVAPHVILPEDASAVDFGAVATGETQERTLTVKNGGNAPLTLFKNWSTSPAFSVSPRSVVVEPGGAADLTIRYTATADERETALLNIFTDDPKQPLRKAFLVGNQEGLGLGRALPETKLTLLDGEAWSTADQPEGSVLVLAYFATF